LLTHKYNDLNKVTFKVELWDEQKPYRFYSETHRLSVDHPHNTDESDEEKEETTRSQKGELKNLSRQSSSEAGGHKGEHKKPSRQSSSEAGGHKGEHKNPSRQTSSEAGGHKGEHHNPSRQTSLEGGGHKGEHKNPSRQTSSEAGGQKGEHKNPSRQTSSEQSGRKSSGQTEDTDPSDSSKEQSTKGSTTRDEEDMDTLDYSDKFSNTGSEITHEYDQRNQEGNPDDDSGCMKGSGYSKHHYGCSDDTAPVHCVNTRSKTGGQGYSGAQGHSGGQVYLRSGGNMTTTYQIETILDEEKRLRLISFLFDTGKLEVDDRQIKWNRDFKKKSLTISGNEIAVKELMKILEPLIYQPLCTRQIDIKLDFGQQLVSENGKQWFKNYEHGSRYIVFEEKEKSKDDILSIVSIDKNDAKQWARNLEVHLICARIPYRKDVKFGDRKWKTKVKLWKKKHMITIGHDPRGYIVEIYGVPEAVIAVLDEVDAFVFEREEETPGFGY